MVFSSQFGDDWSGNIPDPTPLKALTQRLVAILGCVFMVR